MSLWFHSKHFHWERSVFHSHKVRRSQWSTSSVFQLLYFKVEPHGSHDGRVTGFRMVLPSDDHCILLYVPTHSKRATKWAHSICSYKMTVHACCIRVIIIHIIVWRWYLLAWKCPISSSKNGQTTRAMARKISPVDSSSRSHDRHDTLRCLVIARVVVGARTLRACTWSIARARTRGTWRALVTVTVLHNHTQVSVMISSVQGYSRLYGMVKLFLGKNKHSSIGSHCHIIVTPTSC